MLNVRNFRVAMIGSRNLERNPMYAKDIQLCYKVCYRFAELGITFTSGLCAEGMDAIAQKAYSQAVIDKKAFLSQFEVYVMDQKQIHKSRLPNKHLAIVRSSTLKHQMEQIASTLHPNWEACGEYARGMHTRNVPQILGNTLDNPVNAVITWCELDNYGQPKGGTATALKLANRYGIEIFNLFEPDKKAVLHRIKDFLRWHEIN